MKAKARDCSWLLLPVSGDCGGKINVSFLCVFMSTCVRQVLTGRGGTLCMWRMMSAHGFCEQQLYLSRNLWKLERRRREESQEQRGDTGRIVPLSDSPFSLISPCPSYRKPDGGWRRWWRGCFLLLIFTIAPAPLSFSIHSEFIRTPVHLLSLQWE